MVSFTPVWPLCRCLSLHEPSHPTRSDRAAPLACDEISGIFYAYRKLNPLRYGDMKASSIKKKLKDPGFAVKIDRKTIYLGCEHLGVSPDAHIEKLIKFFAAFP